MLPGITQEQFFSEYWRQRPLFIKDGARALLAHAVGEQEFHAAVAVLEARGEGTVRRGNEEVIYTQRLDLGSARLAALARQWSRNVSCPSVWIDGVLSTNGHGIGSHYDDCDNFILQQEGVNHWRLQSPDIIPAEELQRRQLKDPAVGTIYMPDGGLEFTLEPGDFLYIPVYWPHKGTSVGRALSVSVVCNSEIWLHELRPFLSQVLSRRPDWLEAVPVGLDVEATRSAMLERLFAGLRSPELLTEVQKLWASSRTRQIQRMSDVVPAPARLTDSGATPDATRAQTGSGSELSLDMNRIRMLLHAPLPPLTLNRLVEPESTVGHYASLRARTSRIYLKRFFLMCATAFSLIPDSELAESVRVVARSFQSLDLKTAQQAALRPEFTSWTWRAEETIASGYNQRFESLCLHLGNIALSTLIQAGALPEGETIRLSRSTERTIHLLGIGRLLRHDVELPKQLCAERRGDTLRICGPSGPLLEVALSDLHAPNPSNTHVQLLRTVHDCSAALLRRDAWYDEYFPRDPALRASPLFLEIDDVGFEYFAHCMSEGAALIQTYWPAGFREFVEGISLLLPLSSQGLEPHNASVHSFRGLITSSARPSYFAAQTLLHEAGHNKFSSVLDCYKLYRNPDDELHPSPFVGSLRPFSALLHGVFSFLQDIHITQRMVGHVPEIRGFSMERYLAKIKRRVTQAITTIREHAQLTPAGEELMQGCERMLRC